MKIINTLGPKQTDSYKAAQYLSKQETLKVKLYNSFDDIYHNLGQLVGEYMLVPVAYRSAVSDDNWVDNNYKYVDQLKIVDTFSLPTMPMILVKNKKQDNQKIVLHPSTEAFLNSFEQRYHLKLNPDYVPNKPQALKDFLAKDYSYAIVSEEWYKKAIAEGFDHHDFEIIKRYSPTMIWCFYKIIEK